MIARSFFCPRESRPRIGGEGNRKELRIALLATIVAVAGAFDNSGTSIASNSVWGTSSNPALIASAAATVRAFAFTSGSADSAQIINLIAGAYTMQISGANNSTGVALAEVYEAP
jgi:hypothetical protein